MKPIKGRRKASKFKPEDYISNMPDNVVTNILDRLPIQEAVRTGILSRNWRFKWYGLSQLVFDSNFCEYITQTKGENNYGRIISKLLLHFEGAITKFLVYLEIEEECDDIAQWILFLSRKGVRDVTIFNCADEPLELPTHLYSCLELKHLNLDNCRCNPAASFNGFPKLISLSLCDVHFESEKFVECLTQCSVLEILNISFCYSTNLKLGQIAKLTNLKMLTLSLFNFNNSMITSSSSIMEFVGFLPKLHELELNFIGFKSFTEEDATKRDFSTFPCLKILKLSNMDLSSGIMLSFAFQMITSSPSLQTLEIITGKHVVDLPSGVCYPEVDYNTLRLLQLQTIEFRALKALDNELWLIKFLLVCSPFLKKMAIHMSSSPPYNEKLKFATRLLELNRTSPVAKINLY